MRLDQALREIAFIRERLDRQERFRGHRSAVSLATAGLAVGAALAQPSLAPDPLAAPVTYALLWAAAALASLGIVVAEVTQRLRRLNSATQTRLSLMLAEQFLPSLAAGAAATVAILAGWPQAVPALPGLWAIVFGLGVAAACKLLADELRWVAVLYVSAGASLLAMAPTGLSLHPWAMGLTFCLGQAATAGIIHWRLERRASHSQEGDCDG